MDNQSSLGLEESAPPPPPLVTLEKDLTRFTIREYLSHAGECRESASNVFGLRQFGVMHARRPSLDRTPRSEKGQALHSAPAHYFYGDVEQFLRRNNLLTWPASGARQRGPPQRRRQDRTDPEAGRGRRNGVGRGAVERGKSMWPFVKAIKGDIKAD